MKASQWIDQARRKNGWPSDYRAAKELDVSRATISIYRNKPTATMDEDIAVKVAHAVGRAPAYVILDQVIERSRSETARHFLRQVQRTIGH